MKFPRVGLLVLVTAVMLSSPGVSQSLNPLVTRTPNAAGVAPADCNESLAPAPAPRPRIADIPLPEVEPAEAPAPPSGSLRAALQNAQAALARNDRPEFDRAVTSARSLLATYPAGAERRTGEELLRVYEAASRLWDAQYESPFFGEDSPEFALVSGYPGYREALRRGTITDASGRRFYAAAESRDFLARVAGERLRGIGIQPQTRIARGDQSRRSPSPSSTAVTRRSSSSSSSATRSASAAPRASSSPRRMPRPPRSSAPARPRLSTPATSTPATSVAATSTPATSNAATSTPATPNSAAPSATAAAPEPATPMAGSTDPAATSPAAESTATDAVPADADAPDTTATTADTAVTAQPETPPAPPPPAAAAQSRTRSVLLPTILILIGLGVLIVLFRASK